MIQQPTSCQLPIVELFDSGSEFLLRCREFLYRKEAINNTLIALAQLSDDPGGPIRPPFWYAAVVERDEVAGCAIHVLPDGIIATDMTPTAAHAIARQFVRSGIHLSRIAGEEAVCRSLAKSISLQTGDEFAVNTLWQAYVATHIVKPLKMAPGELRLATNRDADVVADFGSQYGSEKPTLVDVKSYFLRKVDIGELWTWDHDGIKTLISVSCRTRSCIRISGVFTPPAMRSRGYAAAGVWAATQHYLNNGCNLVTLVVDKQDPPVMRLYENLGYRKLNDAVELRRIDR